MQFFQKLVVSSSLICLLAAVMPSSLAKAQSGGISNAASGHSMRLLTGEPATATRPGRITSERAASKSFGTDATSVIGISAVAFEGFTASDIGNMDSLSGEQRICNNASCLLVAPVHLPTGVKVTGVVAEFEDTDVGGSVAWGLVECPHFEDFCDIVATNLSDEAATPGLVRVLTAADHVVDSSQHRYLAMFDLSPDSDDTDPNINARAIEIYFQRQVSPAPGSATFGDVPTSHPFFQHVEALALSGITAGCGGGDFCPDGALTRGQMAVFLSKALGLHWPNDTGE